MVVDKKRETLIKLKEFRQKYDLSDEVKAFVFVGRIGEEKSIKELVNNWIYTDLPKEKAKELILCLINSNI